MRPFLKQIGFIAVIYLTYKFLLALLLYSFLPDIVKVTLEGQKEKDKPNLILIGASNLYYNYDYQMLRRSLGAYNISSFNNSASKGGFFILDELENLDLNEKDILVFCLPHSFYESEEFLPLKHLLSKDAIPKKTVLNALKANLLLSLKSFLEISIMDVIQLSQQGPSPEAAIDLGATRNKLTNHYNDSLYEACWSSDKNSFNIKSEYFEQDYIHSFCSYIYSNFPCKVVFRFPPVREDDFNINQERLKYLKSAHPFLNKFSESIYPKELFFDQWYHLNKCGREENTMKTIRELQDYLRSDLFQ